MKSTLPAAALLLSAIAAPSMAQDMSDVEITATEVAPGVAVLFGRGGNIGVSYGEDGTILVDDQFAPLTEKIQQAIAGLGASPTRFLVNTHWHGDHTGGNEAFAGAGASIMAHENVRIRLAEGGEINGNAVAPRPAAALPVITYDHGMTLHVNGDTVEVMYLGGGHTDGDSIVFWRDANVIHMGDLFFFQFGWPFVDTDSGGDVTNLLTSLSLAISMIDEDTVVIPGHGPIATRADLVAYRAMIAQGVDRIRPLIRDGMTLEEAKAAQPLAGITGREQAFISDDRFLEAVWLSLEGHGHSH